ncbi:hypothetical protein [Acuticoccus kandeliae]|uniref:hypothetical protein n=1 Tax=Acuticoccus kandeliae TaxID=2073160 RepID=UPI0013005871|nr:hypothetical protein [Acuticoccus kandeliae]
MIHRMSSGALAPVAALALVAGLLAAEPAVAQVDSQQDINDIRNATPSCEANPQAPWIGRVAGNTQGILDQSIPVSFVGCFNDQATCERWKGRASRIITTTLTQYSCKPRR